MAHGKSHSRRADEHGEPADRVERLGRRARVVPRAPEGSILFLALSGETSDPEVKVMPPLGIDRRDTDGIELVRRWIAALP